MAEFISEGSLPRGKRVYFRCKTDAAGVVIEKKVYSGGVRKVKTDFGEDLAVFDNEGRIRKKPTIYIQELRANKPMSTRREMGIALDLLYKFGELYFVDPENMTATDVERFKQFLMGTGIKPEPGTKVTRRSPHTVNVYLGYIRKFYDECSLCLDGFKLETPQSVKIPRLAETGVTHVNGKKKYRSEATDAKRKRRVPKHVRPNEMREMVRLMKEKNDFLSLCLVVLMYCYGLRAGEALGLTKEDLHREKHDGSVYCCIILRNRLSDRHDQSCKGLYHPKSLLEYNADYWLDSYWEIPIEERHYDLLMQYFVESRDVNKIHREHKAKGSAAKIIRTINSETVADSVEGEGLNHYLFIGRNGNRFSLQCWNYRLKGYFVQAKVKPDQGKRYRNASHRLRHGFAMWYAQYSSNPVTILQLAKMMRHSSLSSTEIYYSITEEDELEIRKIHNQELRNLIPDV